MTVYLDQRKNSREAIVGKIMYSREPEGICYNARLKNCTEKGMEFVTGYPYLKDTRLFLHSKNKDDLSVQQAEVAWSKPENNEDILHPEHFRVGIRFIGD